MRIYGESSPLLTKFCPPEFNIHKGCNTVRLGTLYDFRAEEDEKLRDEGEGTFSYSVEFPELTKVSLNWIEAFELHGDAEGGISQLKMVDDDFMIKGMSLSGSCHNCWIYCLSKNAESAGNISDTHQDKWVMSSDKLPAFANYLAQQLWNNLSSADLPASIASSYSLHEILQRLTIAIDIRNVDYDMRTISIVKEEDLPASEISMIQERIAFIKPKIFESESEVRIAFWLVFDNKKISIVNNPKIIHLRPIDKII